MIKQVKNLAYDSAPWRLQTQAMALVLLCVIVAAIVALFYLNVSAKTAALGRRIQYMTVRLEGARGVNNDDPEGSIVPMEEMRIEIATLKAQLAEYNSVENLNRNAAEMGFAPVSSEELVYISVDGYHPPAPVQLAPVPASSVVGGASMQSGGSPLYQETLLDELAQAWRKIVSAAAESLEQEDGR